MLSSNLRKFFGLSRARPTHKAQLGAAAFCIALVLRLRMDISLSHWFSPLPIPMARRIHCLQRIGYRVSCDYTQVSLLDAQACTMFTQQGIIALPAIISKCHGVPAVWPHAPSVLRSAVLVLSRFHEYRKIILSYTVSKNGCL